MILACGFKWTLCVSASLFLDDDGIHFSAVLARHHLFIYLFLYLVECLLNFISLDIVRGFLYALLHVGLSVCLFFIVGTIYLFIFHRSELGVVL